MKTAVKFKARRTSDRKWVYGFLFRNEEYKISIQQEEYELSDLDGKKSIVFNQYEVIPETICRFTGKYDKENKEIYEHDEISCLDSNKVDGIILWCDEDCMFKVKWVSDLYKQIRGQSKYYTKNGEKLFYNSNLVWNVKGNMY